jgi:hypothetical protein
MVLKNPSRQTRNKETVVDVFVDSHRFKPTSMRYMYTDDGFDSILVACSTTARKESPRTEPKVSPPLSEGRLSNSGAEARSSLGVLENVHYRYFGDFVALHYTSAIRMSE